MTNNEPYHASIFVRVTKEGSKYRAYVRLAMIASERNVIAVKTRSNRDRALGDAMAEAMIKAAAYDDAECI